MPELSPADPPSSQPNATKHGCRSQQLLLAHENPVEWTILRDQYVEEYQPQSGMFSDFVLEAAQMHWFFKRTQRNFFKVQDALPEDPLSWTAEHHHQLALFSRYQTTAERSHQRALAKVQSHRRMLMHRREKEQAIEIKQLASQAAEAKQLAEQDAELKQGAVQAALATAAATPKPVAEAKEPKKAAPTKPAIIEQWVEVRRTEDNQIAADFYPTNDELAVMIEQRTPPPALIYRRLNFPDGVPGYYEWTRPRKGMTTYGGMGIQRMTRETWEELRKIEKESKLPERTGKVTLKDWREE